MLRVHPAQAAGHLTFLWLWTLDFSPTGDLSAFEPAELSAGACFPGDAEKFCQALKTCRWVDDDGKLHDWEEYAGRLLEKREQDKERMRLKREKDRLLREGGEELEPSRNVREQSPNVQGTVPNRTVPNQTNTEGAGGAVVAVPKRTLRMQSARPALTLMRELCGRPFREVESNLLPIAARLEEPGVTPEGVLQMLRREWECRRGNPDDERWFQPETIFRKKNFDGFYSAKDLPVREKLERVETDWIKAKRLDAEIETHPGNPHYVKNDVNKITDAQREAFRALQKQRSDIK